MASQRDEVVNKICELYDKISKLESLKPCENVDMLFGQLVSTCIAPNPDIDVRRMCKKVQDIRAHLINLCGEAEGYLEQHFSSILATFEDNPLHHLHIFPYYNNYLKLSQLEFDLLSPHLPNNGAVPKKLAFIGSGPLPLTSIVLSSSHLKNTVFHNYDIDPSANSLASRLVMSDPDLSRRMFFHTTDVMDISSDDLQDYDVVFLAALVGMNKEDKVKVIEHLEKHMNPGALLVLRSANGPRAFLYPIVDPSDLKGFEVLTIYHPSDDVVNSVVISRKLGRSGSNPNYQIDQGRGHGRCMLVPCNCSNIHAIMNNRSGNNNMIEGFGSVSRHFS